MKLYKYYFMVKHDNGKRIITTVASNIAGAIMIICKAELCPERSLTLINKTDL
jgi:hypothetical protein